LGEPSSCIRRIHPTQITKISYFASGTGAAGLVGAFLWWELRGLGVPIGVGLSSVRPISSVVCFVTQTRIFKVLPFVIPLTYFLLLPRPHAFSALVLPEIEVSASSRSEYTQLPVSEEDAGAAVVEPAPLTTKALSIGDKWQLLKPMIPRYMMPLCKCSESYMFS
jgi:battenin